MKVNYRFSKDISANTLSRLPEYLNYLELLKKRQEEYVSSKTIADALYLNEVQVRKDLASVSIKSGIPKKGFDIQTLTESIKICLGYDNSHPAIIIGAGRLGRAFLSFDGFDLFGINIVAAFDNDHSVCGRRINGKPILHMEYFADFCIDHNIYMAIITVPPDVAQACCNIAIQNGILALLNFAPTHIIVPENILLYNENLATSLSLLSNQLQAKLNGDTN